jgi:hypothetical protein
VSIRHYTAGNGRFADNAFMGAVEKSQQTISFCGVNAHFQNKLAEKSTRDLQKQTRKQLLNAKAIWTKSVSVHLWPYALRNENHLRQVTSDKEDGSCPLEIFTGA